MSEVFRREIARSKPDDGSGSSDHMPLEMITRHPSGADAIYVHSLLNEVRAPLVSFDVLKDSHRLYEKYVELANRCLADESFPTNLMAMRAIATNLDQLVSPIERKESEILRALRHSTKRRWEDKSPLTAEEGALLSPEERATLAELRTRLREKSWNSYLASIAETGASGDTIPDQIDSSFLAYMMAVRDFFPGSVDELLERIDRISEKMLRDELPSDEELRSALTQKFGDVVKGHHNAADGDTPGSGDVRVAAWNQALRKYNTSFS